MKPTLNQVHIDRALTALAVNFKPQQYVADMVCPMFKVPDETGIIWKIDRARMAGNHGSAAPTGNRSLRSEDGTARTLGGFTVAQDTYRIEEYALNDILFDRVRAKADGALALRNNLTEMITEQLIQDREHRAIQLVTTVANLASGHTAAAGAAWDVAGTNMKADVDSAIAVVRKATLGMARHDNIEMVMGWDLWIDAKNNTALTDAVKYVQTTLATDLTPALMAQFFGISKIHVAGAYFDTAGEGLTASLAQFWPVDKVLLFHQEPTSMQYKGFAQTFTSVGGGFQTRTWRDQPRKGEIIETEHYADEKVVNNDAAFIITGANT